MGEVVEVGRGVKGDRLKIGDRVVVPFTIACGSCFSLARRGCGPLRQLQPQCLDCGEDVGHSPSGLFGYYAPARGAMPVARHNMHECHLPTSVRSRFRRGFRTSKVVFLSDIFPTGYMGAENCNIRPGDTVALWGCGPVGQFAIRSCFMLGAGRVIAIDRVLERLEMARSAGAETLNFDEVDVVEALHDLTGNRGPDSCMDVVGMEASGHGALFAMDRAKQMTRMQMDRPVVLRQAIMACKKGGTVSVPGVYAGFIDKVPMGAFMNKALTMKTGQTHMMRYMEPLLDRIQAGEIDPSFVISHTLPIDSAPEAYRMFRDKRDRCTKVILKPWEEKTAA